MAWTAPRTWVAGETVTAALMNSHIRDNLIDLRLSWAAWTSYSPTWAGGSPAIGNGSLTGASLTIGKTVYFRISLLAGSTTTFGSGSWTFTLPSTSATYPSQLITIGTAVVRDNSAGKYASGVAVNTSGGAMTTINVMTPVIDSGSPNLGFVASGSPMTWAQSDALSIFGEYEAA